MICSLNGDSTVAGIIVQMPLPPSLPLRAVIDALDPAKDIDGIHPLNAGLLALGAASRPFGPLAFVQYEFMLPVHADNAITSWRHTTAG